MSDSPWLVVGLGNPGPKYADNRHNVGFRAVEAWVSEHEPAPAWTQRFNARVCGVRLGSIRCVAVLPQTYMNASGRAVGAAARFHRVEPARLVVVHDELDFPFGRLALKRGGGHGGHNGVRDLIAVLGDPGFIRVRLGIGRPSRGEVSSWVLSDFGPAERLELPALLQAAGQALTSIVRDGPTAAMNRFNTTATDHPP